MAPVGNISVSTKLEKAHSQGSNDPVTGFINLAFQPAATTTNTEIFGPLRVSVILQGLMKIHVAENRTSHAYIFFNEARPLFRRKRMIFDGPWRAQAGDLQRIPFSINYPISIDLADEFSPLPPSLSLRVEAVAARQYGRHQGAATVEYSLRAIVEMPGIDVVIEEASPQVVRYSMPPRTWDTAASPEVSKLLTVDSYDLLPEEDRPSGFLGRTKATLTNAKKPSYGFTATIFDVPKSVGLGQSLSIGVRIKNEPSSTTATSIPEVTVASCAVDFVVNTALHAIDSRRGMSPQLESSTTAFRLKWRDQHPPGPFSKAYDNTKTLTFEPLPLPATLPGTFRSRRLTRLYRLRLEITFSAAQETSVLVRAFDILVQQAATSRANDSDGEPGAAPSFPLEGDIPPAYEEATGMR